MGLPRARTTPMSTALGSLLPSCGWLSMIEILYIDGCPNHEGVEGHIRGLLTAAGVDVPIRQRRIESAAQAEAERFLGSPSVRVNGVDVDPTAPRQIIFGLSCRVYATEEGLRRTPPDEWILAALQHPAPGGTAG